VLRGPVATRVINQLLLSTDWGELDYLVLDLPPGTGDVQITVSQTVALAGAVVVTTPQELSFVDVVKGIKMFDDLKVRPRAGEGGLCVIVCGGFGTWLEFAWHPRLRLGSRSGGRWEQCVEHHAVCGDRLCVGPGVGGAGAYGGDGGEHGLLHLRVVLREALHLRPRRLTADPRGAPLLGNKRSVVMVEASGLAPSPIRSLPFRWQGRERLQGTESNHWIGCDRCWIGCNHNMCAGVPRAG
jgi:hypothetical protein